MKLQRVYLCLNLLINRCCYFALEVLLRYQFKIQNCRVYMYAIMPDCYIPV